MGGVMSAAIITRYHGATNTEGARISAHMAGAPTVRIPYPYWLSGLDVHAAAAAVQMARAGWPAGQYAVGELTAGYIFTRTGGA